MKLKKLNSQKGFTIIELMIATSILAIIILIVTVLIINIGVIYDKGVNVSQLQDTNRSLSEQLVRQLQINNNNIQAGVDTTTEPSIPINVYCIGNTRYSFIYNVTEGETINRLTIHHVLWEDSPAGGCSSTTAADLTQYSPSSNANGIDLLEPNTRLTSFCIGSAPTLNNQCSSFTPSSPFTLSVGLAYSSGGDDYGDDLLCDTGNGSNPIDCNLLVDMQTIPVTSGVLDPTNRLLNPIGQLICKGGQGGQFCSTTYLNTVVTSRI